MCPFISLLQKGFHRIFDKLASFRRHLRAHLMTHVLENKILKNNGTVGLTARLYSSLEPPYERLATFVWDKFVGTACHVC